jgi:hypothetical protein
MSNRPLTGVGEGDEADVGLGAEATTAVDAGGVAGDPPQPTTRIATASRRFIRSFPVSA